MEKAGIITSDPFLRFNDLIAISSDNERHEVAKLCKVLQILAQSSLSLIIPKASNKKESLGNSLVRLGFYRVGATGFEPAT